MFSFVRACVCVRVLFLSHLFSHCMTTIIKRINSTLYIEWRIFERLATHNAAEVQIVRTRNACITRRERSKTALSKLIRKNNDVSNSGLDMIRGIRSVKWIQRLEFYGISIQASLAAELEECFSKCMREAAARAVHSWLAARENQSTLLSVDL